MDLLPRAGRFGKWILCYYTAYWTYGTSFFFQDGPFVLYHNGRRLDNPSPLPESANVDAVLTLVGGKGGFGAMLRALGAQIDKTTNREACRDLSGRRLRDVNEEDRLRK